MDEQQEKRQVTDMNFTENPFIRKDMEDIASSSLIDWNRFRGRTIAITGATGLLGKLLVLALLTADRKYDLNLNVLAFVRNEEKARKLFSGVGTKTAKMPETMLRETASQHIGSCLHFCVQDITQPVPEEIHADFLIHTAAITTSRLMVEQPVETIMTAIEGTRQVMEFAARNSMESVVYLSSMEAYGTIPDGAGEIREEDLGYIDPMDVRSSYSEGKRMCENLCAAFASEHQVPVKIARLAATSGPGIDPADRRVIGQFARSVIDRQNIVLHTKGDKANCYTYTADAVCGILYLLLNGKNSEVYNVCNPETFCSIRELGETFASLDETGAVKLVIDIPADLKSLGYAPSSVMKLNADKLLALGWKPTVGLREMCRRIVDYISACNSGCM